MKEAAVGSRFGASKLPAPLSKDLLPLHHQWVSQTRVVKGIGLDQHGTLPSLLPSRAHIFCWRGRWSILRGSYVFDPIINQRQEYQKMGIVRRTVKFVINN